MDPRIIRTRIQTHWIDGDGIGHSVYDKGAEEDVADAQESIRAMAFLVDDPTKRIPVLIDLRLIKSQTREARSYYAGPEPGAGGAAVALLVESRVSKLVGNFYLTLKPVVVPTRIFTSETEAIQWLKRFLM